MAVRYQLVIDCADADRMARFWAAALNYVLAIPPRDFATWDEFYRSIGVPEDELGVGEDRIEDPNGEGPEIWFQVVPDAKVVKNRIHLDVRASGGRETPLESRRGEVEGEVERLIALGATRLATLSEEGLDHYAVAMADPEGNEFDVN